MNILEKREMMKKSRERMKQINAENKTMIRKYRKNKHRSIKPDEYLTTMKDPKNVVEFDSLQTHFYTDSGTVKAVNGVSFNIPKGQTVGVVGESGCGKSVTSLSLMRLIQEPSGQIVGGEIRYSNGEKTINIAKAPVSLMQELRGNDIAMIFQEPMTSLNPVFTVGYQIDETITLHNPEMDKKAVKTRTIEMLKMVGIARAEGIYSAYPHELSGGMRQRVMIAMSLACEPKLIIADEPTTALDVTIQAQILDLLRDLKSRTSASIMLITHDLGVVAEMADYVVVMYAGRVVEKGTVRDIYHHPMHPYTIGLLKSKPGVVKAEERLYSIPGNVPNPINMPNHCYFKGRCDKAFATCDGEYPPLIQVSEDHFVACWLHEKGGAAHE